MSVPIRWIIQGIALKVTTGRFFLFLEQNLQCGTRYQVFVTSQNAVGSSGPSNAVTARTQGDVPLVLALSAGAVTVHADHVAVHLSGWQERGCPITSFGLDYRIDGETLWLTGTLEKPEQYHSGSGTVTSGASFGGRQCRTTSRTCRPCSSRTCSRRRPTTSASRRAPAPATS